MKKREDKIQAALCRLTALKYPSAQFNSDFSGVRLTISQAKQAKQLRSGRGFPDFVLYVRRGNFGALFLELKKEGQSPYKKNGELKKNEHLKEQENKIKQLNRAGYFAAFAVGLDNAREAVRAYMDGNFARLGEVTEGPKG